MTDLTSDIHFGLMLMTGFLGSAGHCVGMCGGYVLTCSVRATAAHGRLGSALRQGGYHLGRVWCYALMGAVSGLAGEAVFGQGNAMTARSVVWLVAGTLMVGFGAHRLGWIPFPVVKSVGPSWYGKLMAVVGKGGTIPHYVLFGFLNGLVPCGLSYGVLPLAAASGNALVGAGLMAAFGMGTIPALGALAATSSLMAGSTRGFLLKVAALLVIGLGGLSIARGVDALMAGDGSGVPACCSEHPRAPTTCCIEPR